MPIKDYTGSINVHGVKALDNGQPLTCRCPMCWNTFTVKRRLFCRVAACPACAVGDTSDKDLNAIEIEAKIREIRASGIAKKARNLDSVIWRRRDG
jgi:hypothetical protein